MKTAFIIIPENGNNFNVETNGVNPITIINAMKVLTKHFARELVKEAEKAVGDNPKAQEQYLNKLIAACVNNELRDDSISGGGLINMN